MLNHLDRGAGQLGGYRETTDIHTINSASNNPYSLDQNNNSPNYVSYRAKRFENEYWADGQKKPDGSASLQDRNKEGS